MATVTDSPEQPLQDKVRQLVVKLLRETLNGRIEWSRTEPPKAITRITEDVIDPFFVARYGDERIGIWQRNSRDLGPEGSEWSERHGLCLLGSARQEVVWDYEEYSPALKNLLKAARNQTVRIEERLDQLLRAEPSGLDSVSVGTPTVSSDQP
jgi:hypothetical protein